MAHRHRGDERATSTGRALTVLVGVAAAATVLGIVALRPTDLDLPDLAEIGVPREIYRATVIGTDRGPCPGLPPEATEPVCLNLRTRLLEGPDRGGVFTIGLAGSGSTPDIQADETIVVARQQGAQPGFEYSLVDRDRRGVLVLLAVAFAVAVLVLGRLRGLAALVGLAATLAALLTFILPAILDGQSPLLVAVVGASAIAFVAIYLAHGFSTMSSVALLGTLAGLGLTALLGTLFVDLARISGFASEEAILVQVADVQLNLAGLILGGIVIGALGVIDDVTVTQASAVWRIREANPGLDRRALFRSGLRIGRDHVASTVNTLVLAYAGASMPLMVLFLLSRQSLGDVANGEVVATEIVRTLTGSIGLVAAVPITTWLAALVASRRPAGEDLPEVVGRPHRRGERRPPRRSRRDPFWDLGGDED
jgi:uncharacterized membrane protein